MNSLVPSSGSTHQNRAAGDENPAAGTVSSETIGMSGNRRGQDRDDCPLGGEIGLGDRRLVVLLGHLERVGIDPHDLLAAGQRGAQRNFKQRVHDVLQAAFGAPASRNARHRHSRGQRHVEMVDAEFGDGVDDGIDQRRRRADRAGLARPLDAERVGAARHDIVGELDPRQVSACGTA